MYKFSVPLLFLTVLSFAQADHQNGAALRQNAGELVALAETANNQALQLPVMGLDPAYETFALHSMTQSFYSIVDRYINTAQLAYIERHLNFVLSQLDRTDTSLRGNFNARNILFQLEQMRVLVAQIRLGLYPPPPPPPPPVHPAPVISIGQCKYKGNFLTPDVVVQGSITGVNIQKATVVLNGAPIGDLLAVSDFYNQNPTLRTRVATINFHQKFEEKGSGRAQARCAVVAVDGFGRKGTAEVFIR